VGKIDLINLANKYLKNEEFNFTGYLMYKDKQVAEIKDTEFVKSLE